MKPYEINVSQKSGFRNLNPGVKILILDERGRPFLDTRYLENRVHAFNLPKGKYFVESGRFKQIAPIDYDLAPLPKPERDKKVNPERFEILVGENPYKCSIDWNNKEIIFDRALCELPLPVLMFIFWHECGHRWYKTEEYCDRYARNKMIEAGYNPSQIGEAILILSDRHNNMERKEKMIDSLIDHFDSVDNCDCSINNADGKTFSDYTSTPNEDWECADWVLWHKDWVKALTDGRASNMSKDAAIEKTNQLFAYHWKQSAPFNATFWGKCGYDTGFFNYFKSIGYTDHISWLAGAITPLITGATELSSGAGEVVGGAGNIVSGIGKNLNLILLIVGVVGVAYAVNTFKK